MERQQLRHDEAMAKRALDEKERLDKILSQPEVVVFNPFETKKSEASSEKGLVEGDLQKNIEEQMNTVLTLRDSSRIEKQPQDFGFK